MTLLTLLRDWLKNLRDTPPDTEMTSNPNSTSATPLPPLQGRWVIFSGAGLSQDSGLDTFREDDGLWEQHSVREVCHASTWRANRAAVNAFYEKRWHDNQRAQPHAGHAGCAQMEARGATLITQNVDTLLERAGAQRPIHVHGRIDRWRCWACHFRWERDHEHTGTCPACSSSDTRVDVVLFGEPAPAYGAMRHVLGQLTDNDTLVIIGTSGTVVNPIDFLTARARVIVVDADWPSALLETHHWVEFHRGRAQDLGAMFDTGTIPRERPTL